MKVLWKQLILLCFLPFILAAVPPSAQIYVGIPAFMDTGAKSEYQGNSHFSILCSIDPAQCSFARYALIRSLNLTQDTVSLNREVGILNALKLELNGVYIKGQACESCMKNSDYLLKGSLTPVGMGQFRALFFLVNVKSSEDVALTCFTAHRADLNPAMNYLGQKIVAQIHNHSVPSLPEGMESCGLASSSQAPSGSSVLIFPQLLEVPPPEIQPEVEVQRQTPLAISSHFDKNEILRQIEFYLQEENYLKARSLLLTILETQPEDIPAMLMLAKLDYIEERYPYAEQGFSRILRLNKEHFEARLGEAIVYAKQKKYALALSDLDLILQARPQASYFVLRARLHGNLGHCQAQAQDLTQACKLEQQNCQVHLPCQQVSQP